MISHLIIALSLTVSLQVFCIDSISSNWKTGSKKSELIIDSSPFLSQPQKKIIYSGLPAYSSVTLISNQGGSEKILQRKSCGIQYDLWNENIETLYGSKEQAKVFKSIQEYYKNCIAIDFKISRQNLALIDGSQSPLRLKLSFTQLTGATSAEIKDWLIGQQSAVLKGLFSHMLGDLQLEESISFKVLGPKP